MEGEFEMTVRQTLSHARRDALLLVRRKRDAKTYKRFKNMTLGTVDELVGGHFETWAESLHPNRKGFEAVLREDFGQPLRIVETGTSAWGTDSTRLWDSYVSRFGGEFWSVDISSLPSRRLNSQVGNRTHLVVQDSVEFLEGFAAFGSGALINLCYLDSWDLDWNDPHPAAIHGLAEWNALLPMLGAGSKVLIDDTPTDISWVPENYRDQALEYEAEFGTLPGKGALILREIEEKSLPVKYLWRGYNVALQIEL